ncbi:MAG: FtsX-like permease family protein, partial [Bacteroidota bacterium]
YLPDLRISGLIRWGTGLAILISCLGLLGLATFAAERRMKEIGVRKVLGASVENIVGLLSREFIILIVIALVISTPLAWYAMTQWLQNFHYHIDMPWWVFLVAGILAILVAAATISWQAIQAARSNPVKALRMD